MPSGTVTIRAACVNRVCCPFAFRRLCVPTFWKTLPSRCELRMRMTESKFEWGSDFRNHFIRALLFINFCSVTRIWLSFSTNQPALGWKGDERVSEDLFEAFMETFRPYVSSSECTGPNPTPTQPSQKTWRELKGASRAGKCPNLRSSDSAFLNGRNPGGVRNYVFIIRHR